MANRMTFVLDGQDRLSRVLNQAGDASDRLAKRLLKLGAVGAAGPIGAGAAAGVGMLAAAFASAGAAAGAFQLAVQPQMKLMQDNAAAAKKVADAQENAARKKAIADDLAAKGSDQAGKAQKAYTSARMAAVDAEKAYARQTAGMPKATAEAAVSLAKLKTAHEGWSASLAGDTMPVFTKGLDLARKLLPGLTPLVKVAAGAFGDFVDSLGKSASGGGFARFTGRLADAAKKTLPDLLNSGKNVFRGLGGIIDAFLPSSGKLTGGIEKATRAFGDWGKSLKNSEGFQKFMDSASAGGGALSNLAVAAGGLLTALSPLLGTTAALATGFAKIIGWLPPATLEFIAGALLGIKVATLGWAGAQALLNIAMSANPVGLIIMGLVLLGAALVTAWKKSQTFREIATTAFSTLAVPILGFAKITLQVWREVTKGFLGFVENVLGLGVKAFGWIPGVGDKLRGAQKAVGDFKDGTTSAFDAAIAKVDGWKASVDRMPMEMKLKGNITDLEKKISEAKRQLSDKNLPPVKRAKLTADISNWNSQLIAAKGNLARTPAARKAMLTGDIKDWSAKIEAAKRQLKNAPAGKKAKLTADIADLKAKVRAANIALGNMKKYYTITVHYAKTGSPYAPSGGREYAAGGLVGFPGGGMVHGPGTSTSDSIPAWLSDGEYVIRAASVNKYGPELLAAINEGRLGTGQPAATAARPAARPARAAGGAPTVINITVNGALDPTAVARQIQKILLNLKRTNGRNPGLGFG
ncbi:hypothetical protein ACFO9E_25675 [Streptomyces maoxianensis]|uniref:Phage tail protein n=1 Tax=Streptomyces maoxianensis TaxID=1459942 RepID=A0ABV9GDC3_9ACTN